MKNLSTKVHLLWIVNLVESDQQYLFWYIATLLPRMVLPALNMETSAEKSEFPEESPSCDFIVIDTQPGQRCIAYM